MGNPKLYLAKFPTLANSVAQLVGTSAWSSHDSPTLRSPRHTSSPIRSSFGRKRSNRVHLPTHSPTCQPLQMPKSCEHHVVPPAQLYDIRFQPSFTFVHTCTVGGCSPESSRHPRQDFAQTGATRSPCTPHPIIGRTFARSFAQHLVQCSTVRLAQRWAHETAPSPSPNAH